MLFKACFLALITTIATEITFKPHETWDCGPSDKLVDFGSAQLFPSPILFPGNVSILSSVNVLEDIPSDNFKVRILLDKLEPQRMSVPCFQRMGSCTYDVCSDMIPSNKDAFCAFGACECPLIKKTYSSSNLPLVLPTVGGPIFAQILQGNFEGNVTFYNGETNRIYGCLGMKFGIKSNALK